MLINPNKHFYMSPNDGSGGGNPPPDPTASPQFTQLRDQYNTLKTDFAKVKEEADKLREEKEKEARAKLEESDRLKLEIADRDKKLQEFGSTSERATQLEEELKERNVFLFSLYEDNLKKIEDEKVRESTRKLTYNEKDPKDSIDRLTSAFEMLSLNSDNGNFGSPGNPPGGDHQGTGKETKDKIDPKTINSSTMSVGLIPAKKIIEQAEAMRFKSK